MYGIVFYKDVDDCGTIVEEANSLQGAYAKLEECEKQYTNNGIHDGGVLEIERF